MTSTGVVQLFRPAHDEIIEVRDLRAMLRRGNKDVREPLTTENFKEENGRSIEWAGGLQPLTGKRRRRSKIPCRFYRKGFCRDGASCEFQHQKEGGTPDERGGKIARKSPKGQHANTVSTTAFAGVVQLFRPDDPDIIDGGRGPALEDLSPCSAHDVAEEAKWDVFSQEEPDANGLVSMEGCCLSPLSSTLGDDLDDETESARSMSPDCLPEDMGSEQAQAQRPPEKMEEDTVIPDKRGPAQTHTDEKEQMRHAAAGSRAQVHPKDDEGASPDFEELGHKKLRGAAAAGTPALPQGWGLGCAMHRTRPEVPAPSLG